MVKKRVKEDSAPQLGQVARFDVIVSPEFQNGFPINNPIHFDLVLRQKKIGFKFLQGRWEKPSI